MKKNGLVALYSNSRIFLLIVSIYLATLAIAVILLGYKQSFLFFNSWNYHSLDFPIFIITHLGDSLILASILSLIFITKRPDTVISVITIVIITGVLGQLLKITFFDGWDRPLRVFNESSIVHTLPDYRLFHNSFPSGHSITAMAAFVTLVRSLKPKAIFQILAALTAILITYTRIYLGVHFPADVLAGSLIGIIAALLLFPLIEKLVIRIRFSNIFKFIIAAIAIFSLVIGVWFLRIYFPLI